MDKDGMVYVRQCKQREEEIEQLQAENAKRYREGYKAGLAVYAWWKDGVQYVGTCGTMLKEALGDIPDA